MEKVGEDVWRCREGKGRRSQRNERQKETKTKQDNKIKDGEAGGERKRLEEVKEEEQHEPKTITASCLGLVRLPALSYRGGHLGSESAGSSNFLYDSSHPTDDVTMGGSIDYVIDWVLY